MNNLFNLVTQLSFLLFDFICQTFCNHHVSIDFVSYQNLYFLILHLTVVMQYHSNYFPQFSVFHINLLSYFSQFDQIDY